MTSDPSRCHMLSFTHTTILDRLHCTYLVAHNRMHECGYSRQWTPLNPFYLFFFSFFLKIWHADTWWTMTFHQRFENVLFVVFCAAFGMSYNTASREIFQPGWEIAFLLVFFFMFVVLYQRMSLCICYIRGKMLCKTNSTEHMCMCWCVGCHRRQTVRHISYRHTFHLKYPGTIYMHRDDACTSMWWQHRKKTDIIHILYRFFYGW